MKSLYVPIWPITGNVRRFRCVAAMQAAGNEPTEDSLKLEKAIIIDLSRPQDGRAWMKILGLDYGDRRIGVAASDAFGWTAQGLEVLERRRDEGEFARIAELVREHEISEIVVGLPKNMNGTVGPRGEICIAFAERLRGELNLPVHLWDERLTTMAAERTLIEADVSRKKRKQVVDKMAASLILQNYLDANSRR